MQKSYDCLPFKASSDSTLKDKSAIMSEDAILLPNIRELFCIY